MFVLIFFVILSSIWGISCGELKNTDRFDLATCDFFKLIKTNHFVDKTMLLEEFYSSGSFIIIKAPRHFGKSSNMNMIQRFSEVVVDEKGNRIERNCTSNYKTFVHNNLQIVKNSKLFNQHFGNYPVIFLDFKGLECGSYESFIVSFKNLVNLAYGCHKYLRFSDKLDEDEIEDFNWYYKRNNNMFKNSDLYHSIEDLSRLLFIHFGTGSVILIDEYDGPIKQMINSAGSGTSSISNFIMFFISVTLKSNDYVEKALLNACVAFSPRGSTDANNLQQIQLLSDSTFSKFYGLTESEVKDLLRKFNISEKIDDVRHWYGGYQELRNCEYGELRSKSIIIYNTFSIAKYLQSNKLKSYWNRSEGVKNLEGLFAHHDILDTIEMLLEDFKKNKQGVNIEYNRRFLIEHIKYLKKLHIENKIRNDFFFRYLTDQGYFTIITRWSTRAVICIPNKEIEIEIENTLTRPSFYKHKFKQNFIHFKGLAEHFKALDKDNRKYIRLIKCIEKIYKDKKVRPYNEHAFQRDLSQSCVSSDLFKSVKTEPTVKGKKIYIFLTTKEEKVILIELKLRKQSAFVALKEILDTRYSDILHDNHKARMIVLLGLHLSGRGKCTISYLVNSTNINDACNVTLTHTLK